MKKLARLLYSALLIGVIASILAAAPAGASLYMHETPGIELVSIRLSPMAAPVGGANQTGQIRSLIIDEQTAAGYRVKENSFTATRVGSEITIHVGGLFFFGADRLDGTIRKGSLTLATPARDGTIRRRPFKEVSEDRWNAAVAKFKQVARLARLGYEYRWWSNEEQQASARLTENKKRLAYAKEQQAKADQALQRAEAALQSWQRRLAAAEKVKEAAAALAGACDECDSVPAIRSAELAVREAQRAISYETQHARDEEVAALGRLAAVQRALEAKKQAIEREAPRSRSGNPEAELATGNVEVAVGGVEVAVGGVEVVIGGLEVNKAQASSAARNTADSVRALQEAIGGDTLRIQQARQQQAAISQAGAALAKKLGLGKKRP